MASHTYSLDGTYLVCLTSISAEGCVSDSCVSVTYSSIGLDESESALISVYPNPAREKLTVINSISEPQMFDLLGKPVRVNFVKAGNEWTARVAHLPKGMYLIEADGKVLKAIID